MQNLFSCILTDFRGRRHIQTSVKRHLAFLQSRYLFSQKLHLGCMTGFQIHVWSVLYRILHKRNQPLLPLKSVLLGKIVTNELAVNSTTATSFKNKILVDVFLMEDRSMLLYERRRRFSSLVSQSAQESHTDKFYQVLKQFT